MTEVNICRETKIELNWQNRCLKSQLKRYGNEEQLKERRIGVNDFAAKMKIVWIVKLFIDVLNSYQMLQLWHDKLFPVRIFRRKKSNRNLFILRKDTVISALLASLYNADHLSCSQVVMLIVQILPFSKVGMLFCREE